MTEFQHKFNLNASDQLFFAEQLLLHNSSWMTSHFSEPIVSKAAASRVLKQYGTKFEDQLLNIGSWFQRFNNPRNSRETKTSLLFSRGWCHHVYLVDCRDKVIFHGLPKISSLKFTRQNFAFCYFSHAKIKISACKLLQNERQLYNFIWRSFSVPVKWGQRLPRLLFCLESAYTPVIKKHNSITRF